MTIRQNVKNSSQVMYIVITSPQQSIGKGLRTMKRDFPNE